MTYTFNGMTIPDHMLYAMERYVLGHVKPGDFLWAVITNDLAGAVGHADSTNMHILPAFVAWFYNEAPSNCWGNVELAEAHLAGGK